MSSSTSTEILIPHFNRAESLRRTLASLSAQTVRSPVCVVDNGSTDHTPEVLARLPDVRCERLDRNLGFGAAVNRGAASSTARLLILLNNDAVADPRFVEEMVAEYERSGAEMVAGCLRRPDGRVETLGVELDRSLIAYDYEHGAPYPEVRDADLRPPLAPSGGAAAFVRESFLALGGFDEAIFAYLEDVELGLRMRERGMRCAVAPRAFAWHEHSATLGARSAAKNELLGWSRGYVMWKHGAALSRRARARGIVVDGVVVAGKAVIDRDLGALRGRLRAWRELRHAARPAPDPSASGRLLPLASFGLIEALRRRLARRSP